MILKIKMTDKSDGWFIYDNAGNVAYSRHPEIKSFFRDSMGKDAPLNEVGYVDGTDLNRTQGSFFSFTGPASEKSPPEPGWFISFSRGVETFEFWGDTEVYMLNDNGKTIERIF